MFRELLLSSLFLFPVNCCAEPYVDSVPTIVTCYKEHTELEYKLDTTSIYKPDDKHINVLVYKYINNDLVSRAVYQYQYEKDGWYVLVHDSNLPDVIRVNSKGKVENLKANLS